MSSLLSQIRSGDIGIPKQYNPAIMGAFDDLYPEHSGIHRMFDNTVALAEIAKHHETIHIRGDSVIADIQHIQTLGPIEAFRNPTAELFGDIPCCTPTHRDTWVEYVLPGPLGLKFAWLSRRIDTGDGFIINSSLWGRGNSGPLVIGSIAINLSRMGKVTEVSKAIGIQNVPSSYALLGLSLVGLLHVFGRMQCRNVIVRPICEPKSRQRPNSPVPACVWHEIHIESEPRFCTSGRNAFPEKQDRRESLIRGHYREAPNHPLPWFRGPFWIPEHRTGNPELGCVIPEYVV